MRDRYTYVFFQPSRPFTCFPSTYSLRVGHSCTRTIFLTRHISENINLPRSRIRIQDVLRAAGTLNEDMIAWIAKPILKGLEYLQKRHQIHRGADTR